MRASVIAVCLGLALAVACYLNFSGAVPRLIHLAGPFKPTEVRSERIDYDLNPEVETFLVYVPRSYDGSVPYGLIDYTYSDDEITRLPQGWKAVLDRRRYIFVAARNAGNTQSNSRRYGLAVMGAQLIMNDHAIDPNRVFAAGLSGGARTAGDLGFYQPDLFKGSIQSCGTNFFRSTPEVDRDPVADAGYGEMQANDVEIMRARPFRFALVTGPGDFRHGAILDIFHGGFEAEGFNAKLFDVPGMGHQDADGQTLEKALNFLETGK